MVVDDGGAVGITSPKDRSELREKWFNLSDNEINALEAEYIFKAQKKYLLSNVSSPVYWFNVFFLQKIHREMFFDIWKYSGQLRKNQTSPGIQPFRIIFSLAFFCERVVSWYNDPPELTLLEQAAIIHHRLVQIHPFEDGNGRFSRLVADRYLKAWKCSFPRWPADLKNNGELRNRYVASLKSADASDYKPLLDFMREFGGKDPALSELLGHNFYKQNFKGERLVNLIKAYLRLGYNVNETVNNAHHPLRIATKRGLEEIVKLLISGGADIHYRDKSKYDAFEIAILHKHLSIAKLLCDHGYPYIPKKPPPSKLLHRYDNLYEFDRRYF